MQRTIIKLVSAVALFLAPVGPAYGSCAKSFSTLSSAWAITKKIGRGLNVAAHIARGSRAPLQVWQKPTLMRKTSAALKTGLRWLVNGLGNTALPGFFPDWKPELAEIYRKQWEDPRYEPNADELRRLGSRIEDFRMHGKILQDHPRWARARAITGRSFTYFLQTMWLAAANFAVQQIADEDDCARDPVRYVRDPHCQPADDEVQLLIETNPPHMAIRIGDKVYSYGYTNLLVSRASEYVLAEDIAKVLAQRAPEKAAQNTQSSAIAFVSNHVSRAIQVVTLKVGKAKRDEIKHYLGLQVWKEYENTTFVNDCSTMTLRLLGLENRFYDPSPSGIGMTLSLERRLGVNKDVVKSFLVAKAGDAKSRKLLYLRNAWINAVDAGLNARLWLATLTLPRRAIVDLTKGREDLQRYSPQVQAVIDSNQQKAEVRLREENRFKKYERWAKNLKQEKDPQERHELGQLALEQLESEYPKWIAQVQDRIDSPDTNIHLYWESLRAREVLEKAHARWRREFSGAGK